MVLKPFLVRAFRDPLTPPHRQDVLRLSQGRARGGRPPRHRWRSLALVLAMGCILALGSAHQAAASDTATPTAGVVEDLWADVDVPPGAQPGDGPQSLAVFRVVWDTGASYRFQEKAPGLGITCVLDGQWSFQPDRDELVIRSGGTSAPALAAEASTLAAGDCAIMHQDVPREEANAGAAPVAFLAIALLPDPTPPPANGPEALEVAPLGFLYTGNWSGNPAGPDGVARVQLRQITVAPGASAPMLAVAGDTLLMVTSGTLAMTPAGGSPLVERAVSFTSDAPTAVAADTESLVASGDSAHMQDGTTVALRNDGDSPATYWLLAVDPAGDAATPAP